MRFTQPRTIRFGHLWVVRHAAHLTESQLIHYLIAPLEASVLRGRAGLEDGLDVDGHVAVGAAEAADDGEAEAVLAPLQLDHLRGLLIHLIYNIIKLIIM